MLLVWASPARRMWCGIVCECEVGAGVRNKRVRVRVWIGPYVDM